MQKRSFYNLDTNSSPCTHIRQGYSYVFIFKKPVIRFSKSTGLWVPETWFTPDKLYGATLCSFFKERQKSRNVVSLEIVCLVLFVINCWWDLNHWWSVGRENEIMNTIYCVKPQFRNGLWPTEAAVWPTLFWPWDLGGASMYWNETQTHSKLKYLLLMDILFHTYFTKDPTNSYFENIVIRGLFSQRLV